ncbi:MAG: preprotein translocase subunit YajC [candidate division NC10 bacterium]|jgi:preprotein translocase subunit YajC
MIELAYAQTLGGGGAGAGLGFLIPLALMFAIFYFILIRPQQKKQRDHQSMLKALKTGDQIVTAGGIYGTIVDIDEHKVKIKIADNVKIELTRPSIQSRLGWEGEKKGKEES